MSRKIDLGISATGTAELWQATVNTYIDGVLQTQQTIVFNQAQFTSFYDLQNEDIGYLKLGKHVENINSSQYDEFYFNNTQQNSVLDLITLFNDTICNN